KCSSFGYILTQPEKLISHHVISHLSVRRGKIRISEMMVLFVLFKVVLYFVVLFVAQWRFYNDLQVWVRRMVTKPNIRSQRTLLRSLASFWLHSNYQMWVMIFVMVWEVFFVKN